MAKYIIHACNQRMDYVMNRLVPDMVSQGINKDDIVVDVDKDGVGNLEHTMRIFRAMPDHGDTWHLQDDVLISSDFKEKTEAEYTGIVCGFASNYDKNIVVGETTFEHTWYSFPCIRIPNRTALKCGEYFFNVVMKSRKKTHKDYIRLKKNDDLLFREYVRIFEPNIKVTNLSPNLVDHIDWLIGGSLVNPKRNTENCKSVFWNEPEKTEKLYHEILNECLQKCQPLDKIENTETEEVPAKRTRRRKKN